MFNFTPNSVLLYPEHGYAFVEVPKDLVRRALVEIGLEGLLTQANIQERTALGDLVRYWLRECGITQADIERLTNADHRQTD